MANYICRIVRKGIAATLVLLPASVLAHQDNVVVYPATECQLRGDDLRAGHSQFLSLSQFGWIGNRTADGDSNTGDQGKLDLHLVCPVPRFARRRVDGITVMVRYRDTERDHPQDRTRFCCTLHNASVGQRSMQADFSDSPAPRDCENLDSAGFGEATMELRESNNKQGSTGVASEGAGLYSLTCLVPPGARMVDYTVHERH